MSECESEDQTLLQRFATVHERLAAAVRLTGRKPGEVELVAVSKWHPAARLAMLARYAMQSAKPAMTPLNLQGATPATAPANVPYATPDTVPINPQDVTPDAPLIFSENYLQEALIKQDELAAAKLPCHWHFSGHLQSNKARQFFGRFELLHTLDSLSLAQNLQKEFEKRLAADTIATPQRVLLQVNIGREAQKSGVMPEELPEFIDKIHSLTGIEIQGLMCLPPVADNAGASRPYFAGLRQLRDRLEGACGVKLPRLSMGMSHDFEVAVQEGATLVRVGTDIFGPRS